MRDELIHEKLDQAAALLDENDIDLWLTFVRETTGAGDPVLPLILGHSLTWKSALIITRAGDRIAIVGSVESDMVESTGCWTEVIGFVEGVETPLLGTLERLDPKTVAVNYSMSDVKADGLTHGMFLYLNEVLRATRFAGRLVSAERIVRSLRGRKSPSEVERMRAAIATTEEIFCELAGFAKVGVSERDVSRFMHEAAEKRGLETAWERAMCPIVTTGPDSVVGHAVPSDSLFVTSGRLLHTDFGVQQNGYCSDLQRTWWVPDTNGRTTAPPDDVLKAFDTVNAAIDAAANVLRPGVAGWQVDDAARQVVIDAGYDAYPHATGHHVGRDAHDGGAVLGPKWERYGETPSYPIERDSVFTLELGIKVPNRGYVGLEEMALVTEDGCEFMSNRETELWVLETQ
jgi:Xaa-Pro aminopeptidase